MGKGKFRPPGAPKPLHGFRWNLEYITMSWAWPHTQIHVALRQRGWSGRTRDMSPVSLVSYSIAFYFLFLLYSSARAEPAQVDRFWRSIRHTTCFRARKCILGSRSYCSPFWGSNPKKTILGAWVGIFKLNTQNIKTCILSKILYRFKPNFAQWQWPPNTLRGWSKYA